MAKASDNVFPKVIFGTGTAPTAPADGSWKVYSQANGIFAKSSNTTVGPFGAGSVGGSVATDTIWDAVGDLAVGTGADTAAKLSIGAVGGHLSRINGAVAWDSGTSFPGSKATGDRYWRSDLGMTAYWDGTRWLTTEIFELGFSMQDAAVNAGMANGSINAGRARVPWRGTYSLYILNFEVTVTLPAGTNNGSNYSTFKLNYGDSADADTQVGSTLDTSALSASTVTNLSATVNAVLSTNARWLKCRKDNGAGTPGNGIFVTSGITYRLVLT